MASFLYTGNYSRPYTFDLDGRIVTINLRGETLQYKFPLKVNVKSYEIEFMEDSFPVRWYFLGKTPLGHWKILDNPSFIAEDGFTLSPTFNPSAGYTKEFDSVYLTTEVMILVDVSTGTSVKIKQFHVYDELGLNRQFMIPFCTSTNSMYHSGSLNFSKIDSFNIDSDLPTDFFAVNHNVLVIENGMGDVMFR